MAQPPTGKLVVILHADVVGSTALVQRDGRRAHERITDAFRRFSSTIQAYHGQVHEIRGDALVAEFARASDAVCASLRFQQENAEHNTTFDDELVPEVRIGISLGEVVIADDTVTGAGVVLAQRLEQLAAPGGVCLQGAAYETVPRRLPFDYSNLGEQQLKGFEQPVRAYAATLRLGAHIPPPEPGITRSRTTTLRLTAGVIGLAVLVVAGFAWWQYRVPSSVESAGTGRSTDQPSVVVLPFTNMSDDAAQEHFVDGMTDDLITDLSKVSGMFVIARHTSFSYKGRVLKVPEIARELGVRYVLEGSVRRAGDQIRVNAQLIDAATGGHLWAERYDGDGSDVFLLQDQVINRIAAALKVQLTDTETSMLARIPTRNLEAYDYYLRAKRTHHKWDASSKREALSLYQKAIELDPEFADAYAGLARMASDIWRMDINAILPSSSARKIAYAAASKALALDPHSAQAYSVLAFGQVVERAFDAAIDSAKKAVSLHPNNADVYSDLAGVLVFAGQPDKALQAMETALRLEPKPSAKMYADLGLVLFWNRQYEKAIGPLETALAGGVEYFNTLVMTYARLGRDEDAAGIVERIREFIPGVSIAYHRNTYTYYQREEDLEHRLESLRLAGIPEWPYGHKEEHRLDSAAIEAFAFGRTWIGTMGGDPFIQEIDADGNVAFRRKDTMLTGTVRLEADRLCVTLPDSNLIEEDCGYLFRNPDGTADAQNEYTFVGDVANLSFSIKR